MVCDIAYRFATAGAEKFEPMIRAVKWALAAKNVP
jgi:hypothetical protein